LEPWSGRFRDGVRRFWHGNDGMLGAFASRITGNSDIFADSGKGPKRSVDFITCHDGFTLMCAQAGPWRCRRLLVADALTARGACVEDIIGFSRTTLPRLTALTEATDGRVTRR
jgi:hypothetical protein